MWDPTARIVSRRSMVCFKITHSSGVVENLHGCVNIQVSTNVTRHACLVLVVRVNHLSGGRLETVRGLLHERLQEGLAEHIVTSATSKIRILGDTYLQRGKDED